MGHLFQLRSLLKEFFVKDNNKKEVIIAINDMFNLNDKLYKSDFNEEMF
jgi:hypothetical protein